MAYYLDLFSPQTYSRFTASDRSVSGFRARQRNAAAKVSPGDTLICYMTQLSRWVGLLRVESAPFEDSAPTFVAEDDPFIVRFKVTPLVWLEPEYGIPIHDEGVWSRLSFTSSHSKATSHWTGFLRASLNRFTEEDGRFLESMLQEQHRARRLHELEDSERRLLELPVVRRAEGSVVVTVPEDDEAPDLQAPIARESIKIQALLAHIGAAMGLTVWVPANDRAAVLRECGNDARAFLNELPLNYDKATLDTIERIDVLWVKNRSIVRAFEVEHTTAIYSGILRMADLRSLQPNMDIKLHIVAPEARKAKVFEEIRRPVFSLLEGRPLAQTCTFLSYDSIREIGELPHLEHLSHTIINDYAEAAD